MADARCPEPKPIFLLLTTVVSALARAISEIALGWIFGFAVTVKGVAGSALEGAVLGVAIGVGVAVSRRLIPRLVAAPVAGFMAFYIGRALYQMTYLPTFFVFFNFNWVVSALMYGSLPALGLVLAHHVCLRCRNGGTPAIVPVLLYFINGAILGSVLVINGNAQIESGGFTTTVRLDFFPWGLATGAVFGALQYLAMLAALAIDRRMCPRLEPPPSAPSPGPSP